MSRPTADHDKKIKNPASLRPTLGVEEGKQHNNAWTKEEALNSSTLLYSSSSTMSDEGVVDSDKLRQSLLRLSTSSVDGLPRSKRNDILNSVIQLSCSSSHNLISSSSHAFLFEIT